jgi:hypothetical protein
MPKFPKSEGFKLGSASRGVNMPKGNVTNPKTPYHLKTETPVIRKELGKGILGEANNDGTIFISDKVTPGSQEERKILNHEMVHMTEMKTGKLAYGDDYVRYQGVTYPRKDGHILYEGEWYEEGAIEFPWEQH